MSSNTTYHDGPPMTLNTYIAQHLIPLTCIDLRPKTGHECAICHQNMVNVHPYASVILSGCNQFIHSTCISNHLMKPNGGHCPQCLPWLFYYDDAKRTLAGIFARLETQADKYASKNERKANDRRRWLRKHASAELVEQAEMKKDVD